MTKLFSIIISLLVLFQSVNVPVDDLLELDELIEHYQFHAKEYGDSFVVFLSKHYGDLKSEHHQKHQEEKEEHEELPFQQQYASPVMVVFVIFDAPDYVSCTGLFTNNTHDFYYSASYSSLSGDGPFQPPQQA